MLSSEEAAKRLKEIALSEAEAARLRLERVKQLPEALRPAGWVLHGHGPDGGKLSSGWEPKHQKKREEAQRVGYSLLDSMTEDERATVFAAFAPRLARALARLWNPDATIYQTGYERRAFRVKGRPDLTQSHRAVKVSTVLTVTNLYQEQDLPFFVAYAPYWNWQADALGFLFAAAMDAGGPEGDEVFRLLLDSARGDHETGAMGRHVTRGLLTASRPDGWEFIEKMLLAAQRQEGLRQSILEVIDEAHAEAFRRMLRLIAEHELMRFSATIRAVDVWFALGWDAPTLKQATTALNLAHDFIFDPEARDRAIATSDDGPTVYLALWALAFEDALAAVPRAAALLSDGLPVRRAAAVHLLSHLGLPEAKEALLPALDDADLRIAAMAFDALEIRGSSYYYHFNNDDDDERQNALATTDVFERLERNLARFPKEPKQLEAVLFPWITPTASGERLANALVQVRGDRVPARLLPYVPLMDASGRTGVAAAFARKKGPKSDQTRDVLISFLGDASSGVREVAMKGLEKFPAEDPVIVAQYEKLLTRKSADLRRSVLDLLLKQNDAAVFASAERLTTAKTEPQRVAGLGLLDALVKKGRKEDVAREKARAFQARRPEPTEAERALLEPLLESEKEQATLDNALGLMDPTQVSKPTPPVPPATVPLLRSDSAKAIIESLDAFIHQHRETTVRVKMWNGDETEMLLGDVNYYFPAPEPGATLEAEKERLPLLSDLIAWWENRPAEMREADGQEALRASVALDYWGSHDYGARELVPAFKALAKEFDADLTGAKVKHVQVVKRLMLWVERIASENGDTSARTEFLLSAAETTLARIHPLETALLAEKPTEEASPAPAKTGQKTGPLQSIMTAITNVFGGNANVAQADDAGEIEALLEQLEGRDADEDDGDDSTDAGDTADGKKKKGKKHQPGAWRNAVRLKAWFQRAAAHRAAHPDAWTKEQVARLWRLAVWVSQPHPEAPRQHPGLEETLHAFRLGIATEADVYNLLLGPRPKREGYYYRVDFVALHKISGRKGDGRFETVPGLRELVSNCRRRILDVEAARGDAPTVATDAARNLRYTGGANVLFRFLRAMGKETFARGYSGGDSRSAVFSHVLRATFPGDEDTPDAFAAMAREMKIAEKRLIEVAMYAPQWAKHVEHALGWDLLAEGVFWLHAHTKDNQWGVDKEIQEAWTAEMSDKTPLTAEDLLEGAVDVAWFHRVYGSLGADRWKMLDDAAKYASSSGGHKRAQLFADAMLGRAPREDLVARIKDKRNQDALRALGLLPLPDDDAAKQAETLSRYEVIQEFRRTSRQFGAQRQESEKKAARIGMENLARTAGYPDPVRLEWAMEARAVADLADGPLTATAGEVEVSLSINALGQPDLVAVKKGKVLANIPPKAKKDPAIAELVSRRKDIERQASRMKQSLEEAMVRGDVFTGAELAKLWEHPVLQPMLRSLAFVEDAGAEPILGYPQDGGASLEDADGAAYPVRPDLRLRLAHPLDLLQTGRWDRYQRDCFLRERVQPFKQVFRELYVLTDQERADGTFTARYSGHQVNPKQALALLSRRGWVSHYEEGARKTFHEAGISVHLDSVGVTFSPLDVEGFTIEDVRFTRRGEYKPMNLADVPPRLFSEAMRDLDLVVSVAHMGGVDPEASASTVEMRAALVREAAGLLKLTNVRFEKSHVLIDGKLATYSVHLGSAIVHRQPGGFVCIVPSHAQHRGRLFLPFADDDPRTAEVVSKVLLLAKDNEIKDPTILEQLLAVR